MNAILGTRPRHVNYSGAYDYQKSINLPIMPGLLRQEEPVPLEDGGALGTLDVVQECTSRLLIFGGLQDHRSLLKTRICIDGDFPIRSGLFHGRSNGERQGDNADIGAAGLDKLRCLRDI